MALIITTFMTMVICMLVAIMYLTLWGWCCTLGGRESLGKAGCRVQVQMFCMRSNSHSPRCCSNSRSPRRWIACPKQLHSPHGCSPWQHKDIQATEQHFLFTMGGQKWLLCLAPKPKQGRAGRPCFCESWGLSLRSGALWLDRPLHSV
jgi:hypothetical protein